MRIQPPETPQIHLPDRRLRPAWLLFLFLMLAPFCISLAQDIRTDLPLNGRLRVLNERGNVRVEVWGERHVAVNASVEGSAPKSSPVIIQRTDQLLSIKVERGTAAAQEGRVNLTLSVPARAEVEVSTTGGEIELRGLPAALTAQSVAGDISADLADAVDADISADTDHGSIAVKAPNDSDPTNTSGDKTFHARTGAGRTPVRLLTESGSIRITLPEMAGRSSLSASATAPRTPPTLIGAAVDGAGVGVPATPSTTPEEIDDDDVVRVDSEIVTLNVSVIDRGTNRGLTGLAEGDFKLYEDNAEQQINHFESSNAPFNLVLLIDVSGSTRDVVDLIRAAALRFVNAARPADSIAVITFAGTPQIVSSLTTDRDLLRRRINTIGNVAGDTKLYDALDFTMDEVLKDAGGSRRTAIVVMSDGLDGTLPSVRGDGSNISYKQVLGRIQEFDGVLYSLWLNTEYDSLSELDTQPEDFDAGHDRMAEMAEAGGGTFYEVLALEDLAGAYERVVADIGTVYSLSYRPTNRTRDGKWRAIRVNISRPNAVARGKRGYYAN